MKYVLLTILYTVSINSFGQSKDTKAVSLAVEELRLAMVDANKTSLYQLTADSLSYGHSSGRVENKKEFIENIVTGKSDFVTIDLTEQTISITQNVAVVRHILTAATNNGGKPGTVKLKVLLVFEKKRGKWKLLARQAVKLVL
ncbi:MAG: nuclear transport factor 2 family protein [Bacteroidetes bacterium]|nr:nuclear transport factor 2 family protein [Bacteroidota bacterium]